MAIRQNRRVDVAITALSDEGLGVATALVAQDVPRTLRVRNALPGEAVVAVVRKRRRGVWYADAEWHDGAAAERVVAPCPAYPRCGGCVLQHYDYAAQIAHKQAVVARLLAEHQVAPERIRQPVSGPRFYYRRKARLSARLVDGELLLGFSEGFSNRVARMSECRTLAMPLAQALPDLAAALGRLSVADRIPQVEVAAGDRGAAFLVRHLAPLSAVDQAILEGFANVPGRAVYLQPDGYDSIHGLAPGSGLRPLSYANVDFGLQFEYLPTDFTQVNFQVNRMLVRAAVLALGPRPGDTVLDYFCGIGNFSLALARQGARVIGFESAAGAVMRARHNAERNGLGARAEFAVQDLYDASGASLGGARLMLLDPPRSGAGPNLGVWAADPSLQRIAYVSCNPESFAKDAVVLIDRGFRLAELGVFDMFPHTAHIETLGLFVRPR